MSTQAATYREKLEDPRWQKLKAQILERDGWKCRVCEDTETRLDVHHRIYFGGRDPWDYPHWNFATLCKHCHRNQYGGDGERQKAGIETILNLIFEFMEPEKVPALLKVILGYTWGFHNRDRVRDEVDKVATSIRRDRPMFGPHATPMDYEI